MKPNVSSAPDEPQKPPLEALSVQHCLREYRTAPSLKGFPLPPSVPSPSGFHPAKTILCVSSYISKVPRFHMPLIMVLSTKFYASTSAAQQLAMLVARRGNLHGAGNCCH